MFVFKSTFLTIVWLKCCHLGLEGLVLEVLQKSTFHRYQNSDDFRLISTCVLVSLGTLFIAFGATETGLTLHGFSGRPCGPLS